MVENRIPKQKRSIEKRNRIIEKGFELICDKGYHKVNTNDIAKYADVSTGILYQYFNDKEEIFIEGVKKYCDNVMFPMLNVLDDTKIDVNNLNEVFSVMIDKFIKNHQKSKKQHEEIVAMSHLNAKIKEIFITEEIMMTTKIVTLLENNGFRVNNLAEKIHIIVGVIDNFCHEVIYHKHDDIDCDIMKDEVVKVICNCLTNK